jgi:hypothetical protein
MYPVLSLLRRAASSVIYANKGHLEEIAGGLCVHTEKSVKFYRVDKKSWAQSSAPQFYCLSVSAEGSDEVARMLTAKENKIYESAIASKQAFTLVFGPEDEVVKDGQVHRVARICLIDGIQRAPHTGRTLAKASRKQSLSLKYGKGLPKGVTVETR